MSDAPAILELKSIRRSFAQGGETLDVLRGADLRLARGEVIALMGPSGAGKSTLLHIAGLLEQADSGEVRLADEDCSKLDDDRRTRLRRGTLGFVYQAHRLLPEFTAEENVILPQMIAGTARPQARKRARTLLESLGLGARVSHRPGQLSGGEQQRVAIARALANAPQVLLADEPTGNLDPDTAESVFAQLVTLAREHGLAAVIATHNPAFAARMDRTIKLAHGMLTGV